MFEHAEITGYEKPSEASDSSELFRGLDAQLKAERAVIKLELIRSDDAGRRTGCKRTDRHPYSEPCPRSYPAYRKQRHRRQCAC